MDIKVIHNEEACEAALLDLEKLMHRNPKPGTKGFEQMELLALVIKDFESRTWPIDPPDPVEAIEFRLEQQGLTRKALTSLLGSRARVSEIFNRRRPLSISMIRKLHKALHISADILIGARTPVKKTARG